MKGFLAFCLLAVLTLGGCQRQHSGSTPGKPSTSTAPGATAEPEPTATENINFLALNQRVPVIMYHDVILARDKTSMWYDCAVNEFADQMKALVDMGAHPVSAGELYKHLTTGSALPEKAVVLTFDDNYQGFYDNAWPILVEHSFPAIMFVHTGFVGNKEGLHPKMTYETLRELLKNPLFTVGSHTITHPDDLSILGTDVQQQELTESKATLEKELGIACDFLAYPNGKNDPSVQQLSKAAGYKMAFSIVNGPAEESPNIWCVNRYVHTKQEKAWTDVEDALKGGALGVFQAPIAASSVAFAEGEFGKVKLALVTGGAPQSVMSEARESVSDFIHRTPGAVAGINGGFFALAAIASMDNQMVGPLKATAMPEVQPDLDSTRWEKLHNRPIVMWGPKKFAIAPYNPGLMSTHDAFKQFMPDISDTFMGGVWLVHSGKAQTKDDMDVFGSKDIQDPRRRAFFGIMPDGKVVLGASKDSCSSWQLANAIAAAGLQEAVLLDSGFSTSLVYGDKIMASGHSTPLSPSRPVPHAIVVMGDLDPASKAVADAAIPATTATGGDTTRRKHKKRTRRAAPKVDEPKVDDPNP